MITQFRKPTDGPERKLIAAYVESLNTLLDPRQHSNIAILHEPRLGESFPDLVVLVWDDRSTVPNLDRRQRLLPVDVKIAHHLANNKGTGNIGGLIDRLGFGRTEIRQSIDRLLEADMLEMSGDRFTLRVENAFVLTRILAVEAKVADVRSVANQASLNVLFSSESYVLMPSGPARRLSSMVGATCQYGIIEVGMGIPQVVRSAPSRLLPASVISWYLNEHIIRECMTP